MPHAAFARAAAVFTFLLVSGLLVAGCDALGGGEDTIVLNNNTGLDPVSYLHRYRQSDVSNGTVTVTAQPRDDLDAMLRSAAGVSRSDIVSAEVTEVTFRRVTGTSVSSLNQHGGSTEVFPYLSRAEVRLGEASGPTIAIQEPVPVPDANTPVEMSLGSGASDVTSQVRNGNTNTVLDLRLSDPSEVGDPFDEVEIEVSYAIEVPAP